MTVKEMKKAMNENGKALWKSQSGDSVEMKFRFAGKLGVAKVTHYDKYHDIHGEGGVTIAAKYPAHSVKAAESAIYAGHCYMLGLSEEDWAAL